MSWVTLCRTDEVPNGQGKAVDVDGYRLAVFADTGTFSVLDSTCPHAGKSIAGGAVSEGCAICPFHFWAFSLETGEMRDSPGVAVTKYASRLIDHAGEQWIQADLPRF